MIDTLRWPLINALNNSLLLSNICRQLIYCLCYVVIFSHKVEAQKFESAPSGKNESAIHNAQPIQLSYLNKHLSIIASDEFEGRKVGTKGNEYARHYITTQLMKINVVPFAKFINGANKLPEYNISSRNPSRQEDFFHHFSHERLFSSIKGTNIIGVVMSEHKTNQYIILTAHFDHLGTKGNKIYNGADDNASGTVALLAIAKKLNQPEVKKKLNHNVIFLFTDGEERNLMGAKAFIHDFSNFLPNIKLNINLDMLAGYRYSTKLYFIDKRLNNIMSKKEISDFYHLNSNASIKIKKGFGLQLSSRKLKNNGLKASDHWEFHKAKIPFIYYGVGLHPNYHTPKDTFEQINLTFYQHVVNAVYNSLLYLDKSI